MEKIYKTLMNPFMMSMNTINYVAENIDVICLSGTEADRTADIIAHERGKKLMKRILSLFPSRERIQTYGPQKIFEFGMSRDTNKIRIYYDPEFFITVYRQFVDVPRRGESINFLELFISSASKELLDEKKKSIDHIFEEYNINAGNRINVRYKEYTY